MKLQLNDLIKTIKILNPENEPGRLTLIIRMGADKIKLYLPSLIQAIKNVGCVVIWSSDPMHGNTKMTANGYKTRNFDHILSEVKDFFSICRAENVYPGGIHLEMTGKEVTECTGGVSAVTEEELGKRYETHCDPRLNVTQALELVYLIADSVKHILKA